VDFLHCTFDELGWDEPDSAPTFERVKWIGSNVHHLAIPENEVGAFDPRAIAARLKREGIDVRAEDASLFREAEETEPDPRLVLARRALRAFLRGSEINEEAWVTRLGQGAPEFFDDILPDLIDRGVVEPVHYEGAGRQRRFKFRGRMKTLADAISASGGDFDAFLDRVAKES
jgi:hypothetical protein